MIQLNCKDIHRRMVRTQKNTITIEIQANVCSTGELLKDSFQDTRELSGHKGTVNCQINFQDI
jgi:hypothetical protein